MSPHPLPRLRALPTVLAVAVVIVLGLWLARTAWAAPVRLSPANARRAVQVYEDHYWGAGYAVTVGSCRRHSGRQISCVATASRPGEVVEVRDWVTLLAHGVMRVHPGQMATTIELR